MLWLLTLTFFSTVGIPKLYWYGTQGDYNIIVMDFLGTNLEDLLKEVGG
jgi:hypothetical protein